MLYFRVVLNASLDINLLVQDTCITVADTEKSEIFVRTFSFTLLTSNSCVCSGHCALLVDGSTLHLGEIALYI